MRRAPLRELHTEAPEVSNLLCILRSAREGLIRTVTTQSRSLESTYDTRVQPYPNHCTRRMLVGNGLRKSLGVAHDPRVGPRVWQLARQKSGAPGVPMEFR